MSDSDSKSDTESVSGDSEELKESDDDSTDTDSDPDKNIGVIVNVNAGTSEDGLAFNYAEDSTVPLSWWRSHRAEYPVMVRDLSNQPDRSADYSSYDDKSRIESADNSSYDDKLRIESAVTVSHDDNLRSETVDDNLRIETVEELEEINITEKQKVKELEIIEMTDKDVKLVHEEEYDKIINSNIVAENNKPIVEIILPEKTLTDNNIEIETANLECDKKTVVEQDEVDKIIEESLQDNCNVEIDTKHRKQDKNS